MITTFLIILAVSGLIDVAFGLWAIAGWNSFATQFGLDPTLDNLRMMGTLLGVVLLFFAYIQAQAIYWIRQEREEGYPIALGFAGFLVVSSTVMFLAFNRVEFLLIDGIRGLTLAVLGTVALRSPLTVKELKLPSRSRSGRDRERSPSSTGGRRDRRSLRDRDRGPRDRASGRRRGRRDSAGPRRGAAAASPRSDGPSRRPDRPDNGSGSRRPRRRTARRRGRRPGDGDQAVAGPDRVDREAPAREEDRMSRPGGGSPQEPRERPRREGSFRNGRRMSDPPRDVAGDGERPPSREPRRPEPPAPDREQSPSVEDAPVRETAAAPSSPSGPPEPRRAAAPKDVISALSWFEGRSSERKVASEDSVRHRRKSGNNPNASFRPREKRVRRQLGPESEPDTGAAGGGPGNGSGGREENAGMNEGSTGAA